MNLDELIATAQPRTEKVPICARGDLVTKHQEAVRALQAVTADDDSLTGSQETVDAAAAVVAVEAEMDAATLEFELTAIPRPDWVDLLRDHPPSPEDRRAGEVANPKTFPVAAVAACCVEPKMSEDKAAELERVLHTGEWNKLWNVAVGLNATGTARPKLAAATGILQANGRSSITPPSEASPEDDSLAGSGTP